MTTQTAPTRTVVHRPAGTGSATWAMGSLFEHLLSAVESGGRLGVSLVTQPPGIATPLHRHTHEDEAFYLLDGTMTYRAGDDLFHLSAGDFIWLPRGLPHAFRITGSTPVRFLGFTDPGAPSARHRRAHHGGRDPSVERGRTALRSGGSRSAPSRGDLT